MMFSVRTPPAAALAPWLALATIYLAVSIVLRSQGALEAPRAVAVAVAFDLCLTAAIAVWFFGVRRRGWPGWTVSLTAIVGAIAAHAAIPDPLVGRVLAIVVVTLELSGLGFVALRSRTVIRAARRWWSTGPIDALARGLTEAGVPARLAAVLATEVVALSYGVLGWLRPSASHGFSAHRRRSWSAISLLLLALLTAETVVLHLLLEPVNPTVAWILTALSLYGGVWIAADLHLLRLVPHTIEDHTLRLRFGVRWRGDVPLAAISHAALSANHSVDALRATLLGANVLLLTNRPVRFEGPYGISRTVTEIALTVDQPEAFLAAIQAAASSSALSRD